MKNKKKTPFKQKFNSKDPTNPTQYQLPKPKPKPTSKEVKSVLDYISNMDNESTMQAMKDRANSQSIRSSEPKQSFGSKALEVVLNPMTAAGYAARNESLPDNFSRGPRNALDYVTDIVNPAQYVHDANNLAQGVTTGNSTKFLEGAAGVLPIPLAKNVIKKVGKYATTKTPLKNTYKLNPFAETLNNPNSSYRVAGLDAGKDFAKTGQLVSKNKNITNQKPGAKLSEIIKGRPTPFPSFQKGYADLKYLPKEGGVIFKTDLPTFKRGEIHPGTGKTITGRHYAHRVVDSKGKFPSSISAKDVSMYGAKPNWLMGHKKLKNKK